MQFAWLKVYYMLDGIWYTKYAYFQYLALIGISLIHYTLTYWDSQMITLIIHWLTDWLTDWLTLTDSHLIDWLTNVLGIVTIEDCLDQLKHPEVITSKSSSGLGITTRSHLQSSTISLAATNHNETNLRAHSDESKNPRHGFPFDLQRQMSSERGIGSGLSVEAITNHRTSHPRNFRLSKEFRLNKQESDLVYKGAEHKHLADIDETDSD